ncbi:MAG: hypothetical protein GY841_13885, partial [FCB group bacterium]|nr:hypothetical protein [FCB group bacterium]
MKKLLQLLLLISLVILPGFSGTAFASSNEIYSANSLIGGGAGALDKIDGALLDDGDMAIVITSTLTYRYYLNASSGAAESSPSIVSPDTNAGTKRWILKATDVGAGGTGLTTITDGG